MPAHHAEPHQASFPAVIEPAENLKPDAAGQRVLDGILQLADHHNWHRDSERRFILVMHVVTDRSAPALHARGTRPGTIRTESAES